METILVTGGAGFIGSNFVRLALQDPNVSIVVVDKLTYAGNKMNLDGLWGDTRLRFVQADIADPLAMSAVFAEAKPDAVINFAAETHVDRSIDGPAAFIQTNIVGTFVLLEEARKLHSALPAAKKAAFRFLHVSTDEVYGSLGKTGFFTEDTPYAPNSPYSASKAGADHLVRAYFHTYGLPVLITNCSNNYGPYQYPEKLVPLMILNALEGKNLPIYGDGGNVRDWLYVVDHCEAILLALRKGRLGEKYNVGASNERTNVQIIDHLCTILEEIVPGGNYAALKTFVADRPGHDRRYAIDAERTRQELGWTPKHDFDAGLRETVKWYVANRAWCVAVQKGQYGRERLGLKQGDGK